MQAVTRPWGQMHVRTGTLSGPVPAVFLNSLGTDLRLWDDTLPRARGLGRVLRLDFRGHGLSGLSAAPYGLDDLVDDVLAAMDAAGLERPVLVGCSVGGLVAQALALRAPGRTAALVLSNTAPRLGTPESWQERIARIEAGGLPGIAEDVLARWFAPAMRHRPEAQLWRAMLERTPAPGYVALCRAIAAADLSGAVSGIAAPCLVVGGSEDGATPPAQVRALAGSIPGARYREFAGVGHLPAAEAPDAFAGALSEFIGELPHD